MRYLIITVLVSFTILSFGQKPEPSLYIQKTVQNITIDGILNETVWQQTEKANDFYISTPIDTSYARSKTEVMLTYDDKNLYVAAVCYDEIPGEYIIQILQKGENDETYRIGALRLFRGCRI